MKTTVTAVHLQKIFKESGEAHTTSINSTAKSHSAVQRTRDRIVRQSRVDAVPSCFRDTTQTPEQSQSFDLTVLSCPVPEIVKPLNNHHPSTSQCSLRFWLTKGCAETISPRRSLHMSSCSACPGGGGGGGGGRRRRIQTMIGVVTQQCSLCLSGCASKKPRSVCVRAPVLFFIPETCVSTVGAARY